MKIWDKYKDTMGLHSIKSIYYEENQQYNDLPNTIL